MRSLYGREEGGGGGGGRDGRIECRIKFSLQMDRV